MSAKKKVLSSSRATVLEDVSVSKGPFGPMANTRHKEYHHTMTNIVFHNEHMHSNIPIWSLNGIRARAVFKKSIKQTAIYSMNGQRYH
jgi:hypothetical protein